LDCWSSIIVAVTAPIIIAITGAIKKASSPVIIGWPAAIDKNGVVHVIIACRGAIKGDVKGRPRNGRWANDNCCPDGIDAPSQGKKICNAESRHYNCERSAFQQRQGVHKAYIMPSDEACQIGV
jgi:hypothetical protein